MRKPDPVELAKIGIPVLAEACAVIMFIAMILVWEIIITTSGPV
jgi:hypothetical protein